LLAVVEAFAAVQQTYLVLVDNASAPELRENLA
jgi:hypothetical protein